MSYNIRSHIKGHMLNRGSHIFKTLITHLIIFTLHIKILYTQGKYIYFFTAVSRRFSNPCLLCMALKSIIRKISLFIEQCFL